MKPSIPNFRRRLLAILLDRKRKRLWRGIKIPADHLMSFVFATHHVAYDYVFLRGVVDFFVLNRSRNETFSKLTRQNLKLARTTKQLGGTSAGSASHGTFGTPPNFIIPRSIANAVLRRSGIEHVRFQPRADKSALEIECGEIHTLCGIRAKTCHLSGQTL
jgi:hypothetical protein